MEPDSGYEKLVNEKCSPRASGDKKRLRFKFCRMLSAGNVKANSTPASPSTPQYSPIRFEYGSNSLETLRRPMSSGNEIPENFQTHSAHIQRRLSYENGKCRCCVENSSYE